MLAGLQGGAAHESDASELSEIIGMIYEAATDPSRWPHVLDSCRHYVGGLSAAIFSKNVSGNVGQVHHYDGRVDPEQAQLYFAQFAPIDPSNTIQVLAEVGNAVVTSSLLDADEFAQSRFAREWAVPQGIVDMVVAPIERRGSWAALFGVFRHERDGIGDERARERVSLLAPHIRRAISIGDMLRDARDEAASFREIIDRLATGFFLLDAEGRLVHANAAGRKLLGTSGAISTGHDDVLRLERTNLRALLPGAGQSDGGDGTLSLESRSGERYVAHVLPLAAGEGRTDGTGHEAVAALFVQPARFEPTSIPESLAKAFDLTPSELRVMLSTIRHEGVADVAESLGIGEATVRTHLHRIFAKTETRRQADLVKLAAGFASPLAAH